MVVSTGDMERRVGVQVTPVCDRHANTVAKVQIGQCVCVCVYVCECVCVCVCVCMCVSVCVCVCV